MRYAIETHNNPQMFSIHCEKRPPEIPYLGSSDITGEAKRLKGILEAIPGVVEARTHGYCISITRGGVFTIDELEQPILEKLREWFGVEELEPVEAYVS